MEEIEMTLRPSQWINVGWILFGLLGIPLVIPPIIAIYKVIETYCHKYDFYPDIVLESSGVFDVTINEVHYYRIKSIRIEEPFLYRFVGLSDVYIRTSAPFHTELKIIAIPYAKLFVSELRLAVETERKNKGVKELDIYEL